MSKSTTSKAVGNCDAEHEQRMQMMTVKKMMMRMIARRLMKTALMTHETALLTHEIVSYPNCPVVANV